MLICYRKLRPAEINYKILLLSKQYRNEFPAPRTNIRFVDENEREVGQGSMHSGGTTRIDGLTWWYNQHSNISEGSTIGIYREDNNNYRLKLEEAIEIDETPKSDLPSDGSGQEDNTSFLIEKPLEHYLSQKLDLLEDGLGLVGTQYPLDYEGRRWYIDILAKDNNDNLVVIELKAGTAKEAVCGQISKYIALIKKTHSDVGEKKVRGIIVANEFDIDLQLAVSNIPDVLLKKYSIDFRFEDVN